MSAPDQRIEQVTSALTPEPRRIRAGLIGCGAWGRNIAAAVDRCGRFELVAVADTRPEEARQLAGTLASRPEALSPDAILESARIEAVLVVTDAATHYDLASRALARGKHTFVEKPIATSARAGAELVEAANRADRILMVGHTFLYSDYVRHVDQALGERRLGDLRYVHLQRLAFGRFRDDVNVIWNLGPHDVSILMHWAKRPPSAVRCVEHAFARPSLSDVALLTLDFDDWLGHVHLSVVDPQKVRRATVVGTSAGIVYDDVEGNVVLSQNTDGERRCLTSTTSRRPLDVEIDHFAQCVLTGHQPVTDGVHGTWVSAVLEQAAESAAQGGAWREVVAPVESWTYEPTPSPGSLPDQRGISSVGGEESMGVPA